MDIFWQRNLVIGIFHLLSENGIPVIRIHDHPLTYFWLYRSQPPLFGPIWMREARSTSTTPETETSICRFSEIRSYNLYIRTSFSTSRSQTPGRFSSPCSASKTFWRLGNLHKWRHSTGVRGEEGWQPIFDTVYEGVAWTAILKVLHFAQIKKLKLGNIHKWS